MSEYPRKPASGKQGVDGPASGDQLTQGRLRKETGPPQESNVWIGRSVDAGPREEVGGEAPVDAGPPQGRDHSTQDRLKTGVG